MIDGLNAENESKIPKELFKESSKTSLVYLEKLLDQKFIKMKQEVINQC